MSHRIVWPQTRRESVYSAPAALLHFGQPIAHAYRYL
jgi:hypothetical protein